MAVGQPFGYTATVWSFGERGTINAGLTRHLAAHGGAVTAASSELAVVVLHTGTLKNLTWSCTANGLTGVKTVLTVYVNGVASGLTTSWPPGVTSGKAGKGEAPVKPGDTVSMRIQTPTGVGSITRPRASIELEVPSDSPWWSNATGMYYAGAGMVGIGTDSPAETLSVNGTIESIAGGFRFPDGTLQTTAFGGPQTMTPPGSVIAFAGASAPVGWLLCDGAVVDRTAYPELFAAIGIAHGEGDGSTTFALPDYRGTFLRGVNGARDSLHLDPGVLMDPDATSRTAAGPGGNQGNAVGSLQVDAVRTHFHRVGIGGADSFTMAPGGATGRLAHFTGDQYNAPNTLHFTDEGHTLPDMTGPAWLGYETRPTNAYVNFLIKT